MPELTLYKEYSRQEVHDIFSPDTRFTPSSGIWGLHGIVEIPNKPGDFIFFVTFGQKQAGHIFEEWITEEGIISWQSQPKQSLNDRKIQKFIHHNEKQNAIHLFLRTNRTADYTYLGRLGYSAHDPAREKPVYMYWQLLDWPIPPEVLSRINLRLQPASVFHQGKFKVLKSADNLDYKNAAFTWRGMTWQVNLQDLVSEVRDWIVNGLPEEAIRYKDWYVDINGHRVSPKWLFHLITGAYYNEFDAPLAREKLSRVGLKAVQIKATKELDGGYQKNSRLQNPVRLKPTERQELFQKIAHTLSTEFHEASSQAEFRFPSLENWFEIRFPNLKGYYSLRLAREFDEFAYFFPGNRQAAELFNQKIIPYITTFSEQMEHSVSATPSYRQSWSRLGFETPSNMVSDRDDRDSLEIAYARLLGRFIQVTYHQLLALLMLQPSSSYIEKNSPNKDYQPQIEIFNTRVDSICKVLTGVVTIPSSEVLCDWVHFCYDFGMYKEGEMLFSYVISDDVYPWYYERTKKFARLCAMRAVTKDDDVSN